MILEGRMPPRDRGPPLRRGVAPGFRSLPMTMHSSFSNPGWISSPKRKTWPEPQLTLCQKAAENRLVHAELLLDRGGGQTDLPADPPRRAASDQPQLNAVGIVEATDGRTTRREIFAAPTRRFELGQRDRDFAVIHDASGLRLPS
jgi:hypothetical protein